MSKKILKLVVTMMVMLLLCACGKKEEEYSVAEFEEDMEAMTDAISTLGYLNEKAEQVEEWVEEATAPETTEQTAPVEEDSVEETSDEETSVEEVPEQVTPVEETPVEEAPAEEAPAEDNGMDPEFKAAMDSYEAFYREYCDILKQYNANPTDLTLLTQYTDLMQKSIDMSAKFEAWDESELNTAELQYYTEVNGRVTQMLLEVGAQ